MVCLIALPWEYRSLERMHLSCLVLVNEVPLDVLGQRVIINYKDAGGAGAGEVLDREPNKEHRQEEMAPEMTGGRRSCNMRGSYTLKSLRWR